jgi:hypothetical protein
MTEDDLLDDDNHKLRIKLVEQKLLRKIFAVSNFEK